MSSYHINTRQKAEQALRQIKPTTQRDLTNELYPGVIEAANGDGWDVATVDASGNVGRTYERVFSHPVGASISTGDEVWLWLPSDGESPLIMQSGGGGGCGVSINAFGVKFAG